MVIQVVTFKTTLRDAEVRRLFEQRVPQYRNQPGLMQKYYLRDTQTGAYGGIYVWDSADSLRGFRETDLARTISAVYHVTEPPHVETFELLLALR